MSLKKKTRENIIPIFIVGIFVSFCIFSVVFFGPTLHAELSNSDEIQYNTYEVLTVEQIDTTPTEVQHTEQSVGSDNTELLSDAVNGQDVYLNSEIPAKFNSGDIYRHGQDYYQINIQERQSAAYPTIGEIESHVIPILTIITATVISAIFSIVLTFYYIASAFVFEYRWEFRETDFVFYSLTITSVLTSVSFTIVLI